MEIGKGDRVRVYQKPYSLENFEEEATVTKVLDDGPDWDHDINGKPMVRCNVRFDGEREVYQRKVSVKV